mmetsp:Transcript_20775/g.42748  ORF Transcript_20775/g.42748 Transcript_20775/m.42748 type:complete len:85 (+) Transcript_20775:1382-1636(+)
MPRLRGGMVNDRLFDSFELESNRMGINRRSVVEIDPSVNNRSSDISSVVGSVANLQADGHWRISHCFSLSLRYNGCVPLCSDCP